MKILALEQAILAEKPIHTSFSCYPDSSLLRNNDNFYIPNFTKQIIATVGVYVAIHKIGKHILPTFIHRYYNACGMAINFVAADYKHELQLQGLSTDAACGFDHSFAISKTIPFANNLFSNMSFTCVYNTETYSIQVQQILEQVHEVCAKITEFFTIKIGDVFYIPLWDIPQNIAINDTFDCTIQNEHILHCRIQ